MTIWAWLLRDRSGGILNPAMAFAYAKVGQIPFGAALCYALVQIIGGLFAGGLIYLQLSTKLAESAKSTGSGIPNADSRQLPQAFVCELLATMFQSFVLMGLVTDKKCEKEVYAIGYGALSLVAEIALPKLSGGTCNPARLIGPAAVLYRFGSDIWIPVLAQIIGALVGAMLYDEIFRRTTANKTLDVGATYDQGDENGEGQELMLSSKGGVDIDLEVEVDVDAQPGFEVSAGIDLGATVELEVSAGVELEVGVPDLAVELEVGVPDLAVELEVEVEVPAVELEVEVEVPAVELEVEVEIGVPEVELEIEVEIPAVELEVEVEVPEVEVEVGLEVDVGLEVEAEVVAEVEVDVELDVEAEVEG